MLKVGTKWKRKDCLQVVKVTKVIPPNPDDKECMGFVEFEDFNGRVVGPVLDFLFKYGYHSHNSFTILR